MKWKLIVGLVVAAGLFLAGYVPQFLQVRRLEVDLESARQKAASCELDARLSRFRDLATSIYLEAARKNYGLAATSAGEFFQGLRQLAGETSDQALKTNLEGVLGARDSVTAGLAKADAAVLAELEGLVANAQRAVRR